MTTTTYQQPSTPTSTVRRRPIRATAVAAAVAATGALYVAGSAAGIDFTLTDPGRQQVHHLVLPEIIGTTLVVCLLGWGALAVLERRTDHAKPVWSVLAGLVLLLSFAPITSVHAPGGTKLMLVVIHLTVAAALVPMLRHSSPRRPAASR